MDLGKFAHAPSKVLKIISQNTDKFIFNKTHAVNYDMMNFKSGLPNF